jgi:soluble lytic murein transglycosylase-like protein
MKRMGVLAAPKGLSVAALGCLLSWSGPAWGQGTAKSDLALAGAQAGGWDASGFMRLYDAARYAPNAAAVRAPEIAGPMEVSFSVGPAPTTRPAAATDLRLLVPPPAETPAYRRTFKALLARPQQTDKYDELILKYAALYRLDARLLKSIIAAESEFLIHATSPKGARGLMQVMPATAEEMGVPRERLAEAEFNIAAGAAYVARLFQVAFRRYKLKGVRFHEAPLWLKQRIIAAYNAGPKFLFRHGGWYKQTLDYVKKVLLFYHSKVTDFRRGGTSLDRGPRLAPAASTGTLY